MEKFKFYETSDLEERNATMALYDLFESIAGTGMTEDPLALVCQSLVRCVEQIQFAFYCYESEETGRIIVPENSEPIFLPPPDVERKIVANMRRRTRKGSVVVIEPEDGMAILPRELRKKWKCHRAVVTRVQSFGRPEAVLAIFFRPEFKVNDRHRAWLAIFGNAASALISSRTVYAQAHAERDDAVQDKMSITLTVESVRTQIREHLLAFAKISNEVRAGSCSYQQAWESVLQSLERLNVCLDTLSGSRKTEKHVFRDRALEAWVQAGLKDPRIKAIVGCRGSRKSCILHEIYERVKASGVSDDNIVIISFEDARFRRFRTAKDVLEYLKEFPKKNRPNFLFLDELGMINWHTELLRELESNTGWNVWIAASTAHVFELPKSLSRNILLHRVWADPIRPRSRADLEKIWCQIFMRDVVAGVDHPDIRAKEVLAEYYSDHLGELKSLREIADEMRGLRRTLSRSSISAYRKSLVDAYLIELSEVYDVFEGDVVRSLGVRAFYTDIELRQWRFGSAPTNDAKRLALNRLYLKLRQKYVKVYTPRDNESDFVTLDEKGKPHFWNISLDLPPPPPTHTHIHTWGFSKQSRQDGS